MSDELPDLGALIDQALRANLDLARVVRGFHVALAAQGFTEDQALQLSIVYLRRLLEDQA